MEFAKWNLEAHRGLWWKTKYLPLKTEKKLSEKLLCVLLVHLTELKLSPQEAVHLDFSCEILKVIFGNPLKAMVKKEISSFNNWKETFWETAVCSVNTSHRVTAFLSRSLSVRLVLWNLQSDIWKPIEGYGKKRIYLPLKTEKKLSEKLICVLLIHLTELQLSPQEAVH